MAVLEMPAGKGGSEVNALTNTPAFEGRRCIIHSASRVPAAWQRAPAHASLIGSVCSCRSSSGGGPDCRAQPTLRISIKLRERCESSSRAHVRHVRSGACTAQPGWGR